MKVIIIFRRGGGAKYPLGLEKSLGMHVQRTCTIFSLCCRHYFHIKDFLNIFLFTSSRVGLEWFKESIQLKEREQLK